MAWQDTRQLARSHACNGEMVRFFRKQRGWTQIQLAEVAGYTERLVRKAEARQALHADTIENLAEALSTRDCVVHPEDLVCDPRAVVWRYIESFGRHERQLVAHAQHALAEDVQNFVPGDPNVLPFAGHFDGRDDLERWSKAFFSMFERTSKKDFLKGHLIVEGKQAVWISRDSVRLRGTNGPEWHVPMAWVMETDRGKIVRCESFLDTHPGVELVRRYGKEQTPNGSTADQAGPRA